MSIASKLLLHCPLHETDQGTTRELRTNPSSRTTLIVCGVCYQWTANRLDRINQVSLPLDGYYSSGDYDGRGVHGEGHSRLPDRAEVPTPCPAKLADTILPISTCVQESNPQNYAA